MPVELHERLSEFSYGYGVTREVERLLRGEGLRAVPFLPSLLHEARLGFDVGFNLRGTPLLLQFKLGQALRRFTPGPAPRLDRPYWRFRVDTAERDGQFELLLKAERDGADVFYLAPKFHDWETYLRAFECDEVIERSSIIRPGAIRETLDFHGVADGVHKVVYDNRWAYLCSSPLELESFSASIIAELVTSRLKYRTDTIGDVLKNVFEGFNDRSVIRRAVSPRPMDRDRGIYAIPSERGVQSRLRLERIERIIGSGRDREEAIALAVGAEAWSSGAQLIYVTE